MGGKSSSRSGGAWRQTGAPAENAGELEIPSAEAAKLADEDERARAAEELRAGRIKTQTETDRQAAEVRMETVRNLTLTRNYDKKTPTLINSIRPNETPETQTEAIDALEDVSTVMLAILFKHGHAANLNLNEFNNVQQLGTPLAHIDPRAAENATLHKLREFSAMSGGKSASEFINVRWPRILTNAKGLGPTFAALESLKVDEKPAENEHWVRKFARKNPKTTAVMAIAGAVGLAYAIRGVFRWLTGSDEKQAQSDAPGLAPSRWSFATGKGTLGMLGILLGGSAAAWAFGRYVGFDKVAKWIKENLGIGSLSDTWSSLTGGHPELEKNRAMYTLLAGKIGAEMSVPVEPGFLSDIGSEKYSDVVEDDGWFRRNIADTALDNETVNTVARYVPGIRTKEQRNQVRAIRTYLNQNKELLKDMAINDETTLNQVLAHIYKKLTIQEDGTPQPGQQPGQQPETASSNPELTPEKIEARILPYFASEYGAINALHYRQIISEPYEKLMETSDRRSMFQSLAIKARQAGAEIGVNESPEAAEEEMLRAGTFMRRFFQDRQKSISALTIPAGATVGKVLRLILESEVELKPRNLLVEGAVAELSDKNIEGIEERDKLARELPAEKLEIYSKQRRDIAELFESGHYLSIKAIENAIAGAREEVRKILDKNIDIVDRDKRAEQNKRANAFEVQIQALENALRKRTIQWKAYTAAIRNNWSEEKIHDTFLTLLNINDALMQTYSVVEDGIANEQSDSSIKRTAALQMPRALLVMIAASAHHRSIIRRYWGQFAIPTAALGRLKEKFSRPRTGSALTLKRIEEAQSRLRGTLGGGGETGIGNLFSRAEAGLPKGEDIKRTADEKQAMQRYIDEKDLLEHDKLLLKEENALEVLEREADDLRKVKSPSASQKSRLTDLESQIADQTKKVRGLGMDRIIKDKKAIEEAAEDTYKRLGEIKNRPLKDMEWEQIDDLSRRTTEHQRDLARAGDRLVEDIRAAVKRGAPAAELDALKQRFSDVVGDISETQKGFLRRFGVFFSTYRGIKEAGLSAIEGADQKNARAVLSRVFHWARKGGKEATGSPLLRISGKKIKFYTLAFAAISGGVGALTMDEKTSFARASGQAAVDLLPITGTLSDFDTALFGRERISGRKITGAERIIWRPLFCLVGAASDALLLAGVGVAMRGKLSALREARSMHKVVKMKGAAKTALEKGAKAAAGEAEEGFFSRNLRKASDKVLGRTPGTITAEESSRLMGALRKFSRAGAIGGVALGFGGLALNLVQSDEMEMPESLQSIVDIENLPVTDENLSAAA